MDEIKVEILADGSLRLSTGAVSAGNHRQADDLMKALDQLMAGKVEIKSKKSHSHSHSHEHEHHKH